MGDSLRVSYKSHILKPLSFSPWGKVVAVGYLGTVLAVSKYKLLSSPDELVNGGHKLANYFKTGDTNQFKNEVYHARCVAEPGFGTIGGYRDFLNKGAALAMIVPGFAITAYYGRRMLEDVPGFAKILSKKATLGWMALYSLSYCLGRFLPDWLGHSRLRGSYQVEPEDFSFNLFSSEWGMRALLTPMAFSGMAVMGQLAEVLFDKIGRSARSNWIKSFFPVIDDLDRIRTAVMYVNRGGQKITVGKIVRTIFEKPRIGYMSSLFVAGASVAFLTSVLCRWAQAFTSPAYIISSASVDTVKPIPKLLGYGAWSMITTKPMPIFFYSIVTHPITIISETLLQNNQVVYQKYKELAQGYRYSPDEWKREQAKRRMQKIENLLNEAILRDEKKAWWKSDFSWQLQEVRKIKAEFLLDF
ncbi:MAG: hypothetical protein HYW02_00825 [Deltaproteobacteria bacterium]|nr:hypothetical protein [Deltaproteobacteria bacterium]MBI2500026.1 hypothetical protein [Deltaproteobacteria bacterium]